MSTTLLGTSQVLERLHASGVEATRRRLDVALERDATLRPALSVPGRRLWTTEEVERLRAALEARRAQPAQAQPAEARP